MKKAATTYAIVRFLDSVGFRTQASDYRITSF